MGPLRGDRDRRLPAPKSRTFPPDKVEQFGSDVPLGRAGEAEEVATCFVFLASDDASYMTDQVLHPNGGEIVNA